MLVLTQSFSPEGPQVSRHGTEFVHLMLPILLAAAVSSCTSISEMIERAKSNKSISPTQRDDIVLIYQEYAEIQGFKCNWDANAD